MFRLFQHNKLCILEWWNCISDLVLNLNSYKKLIKPILLDRRVIQIILLGLERLTKVNWISHDRCLTRVTGLIGFIGLYNACWDLRKLFSNSWHVSTFWIKLIPVLKSLTHPHTPSVSSEETSEKWNVKHQTSNDKRQWSDINSKNRDSVQTIRIYYCLECMINNK